ncbi:DMT family transporter [Paenibacillus eucommiae]|uniref:Paired small multidrug resistance pump n=1 Tax=Paenibacillus eucommiae TaxID=1355755 RepID=A0ABS4IZ35_9BACL|nr:SMR family transporter [Paenibacillus eucommiae]MBP1992857.1 paired small multidrug resistance pump [Paenibacillus eucommiae]
MNKNWMMVFSAGLMEVIWVSGLKHSTTWWMWLITAVVLVFSFIVLIRSFKKLPVGTVYAVFTGLGTAGTVAAEMLVFNEPFRWEKALLILILLIGVVGLKAVTHEPAKKGVSAS